jgi:MraZ protein
VDSKGRVKVPARMLKALSSEANDSFVLTLGQDSCIYAYPMNEWLEIEKQLKKLNTFDQKDRYFLRRFLMNTEDASLDAQQRIILPKKLTDQTGIKDNVSIVGLVDHIEFWNPETLKSYIEIYDKEYEKISEEVMSK